MKKNILFLAITLFPIFLFGCSNRETYDIKKLDQEKIEFLINNVPFRNYATSRTDISEEMFIQGWKDQSDIYTTKGNKIYFYEYEIKGADIATFIPLVADYALDKDHIYLGHEVLSIPLDQFNFVSGAIDYLTDGTSIYWGNQKLEGVDIESFIGMGFEHSINHLGYAKDKNNYYFRGEILTGEELKEYFKEIEK
ncbi:MAG TPA: DKNYY domain-containing protein [Candidatus Absconditabacterales bacterium]|nr:DKNYY domain-containing protein [Candidatus Absconditabacterales bacterium]